MNSQKKLAIITVHNGTSGELERTLKSIDNQINKPHLSLIVAKQIKNFNKKKYLKKYRNFIIGKDKSLWNAMNISLNYTQKFFILFLNSGDIFYNNNSVTNILNSIKKNSVNYIFKTQLVYDDIIFTPKSNFFCNKSYSPHPAFVRCPLKSKNINKYNEKNLINADGEWMQIERQRSSVKKINKVITKHYLDGQSTNPKLGSVYKLFYDHPFSGVKEFIKLILNLIFEKKIYYKLIYFLKYKIKNDY